MGGLPWRVFTVLEDSVIVEPESDYMGAIPSWVGEEIPVPFEVAQEVGKIRERVEKLTRGGLSLREIASRLRRDYGWDEDDHVEEAIRDVYEMTLKGIEVPSHHKIVIEEFKGLIVVHAHFGTRVNRTLGRYIAEKISEEYGLSLRIIEKPYFIVIYAPELSANEVAAIIKSAKKKDFAYYVKRGAEESRLFKWRLVQVARKTGAVDPQVKLTRSLSEKLVTALRGTPIFSQALKEVLERDLDLEATLKIVEGLESGEIDVKVTAENTPLLEQALYYIKTGIDVSKSSNRLAIQLMLFKTKILSKPVTLACLECAQYIEEVPANLAMNINICPLCGSDKIIVDSRSRKNVEKDLEIYLKEAVLSKRLRELIDLKEKYGENLVLALATGLGLKEIKRLLKEYGNKRGKLLLELWKAYRIKLLKKSKWLSF